METSVDDNSFVFSTSAIDESISYNGYWRTNDSCKRKYNNENKLVSHLHNRLYGIWYDRSNDTRVRAMHRDRYVFYQWKYWLHVYHDTDQHIFPLGNDAVYGIVNIHYGDVIMGTIASQITSLTIVYPTVYSDADQRKHQSFATLAFVWGIHRGPVNSPHKWPVTRKMLPFDDVIIHCWWGQANPSIHNIGSKGIDSVCPECSWFSSKRVKVNFCDVVTHSFILFKPFNMNSPPNRHRDVIFIDCDSFYASFVNQKETICLPH